MYHPSCGSAIKLLLTGHLNRVLKPYCKSRYFVPQALGNTIQSVASCWLYCLREICSTPLALSLAARSSYFEHSFLYLSHSLVAYWIIKQMNAHSNDTGKNTSGYFSLRIQWFYHCNFKCEYFFISLKFKVLIVIPSAYVEKLRFFRLWKIEKYLLLIFNVA